ncbi:hypothetical protein Si136_00163 [Streptococcus infantarius subsp. infantarius]|nr:hypothetical protein [Streptococcus infantarius subsp. infantarius]
MKIKIPRPNSVNFWLFSGLVISFLLEILVQMAIVSDNTITKIVQYILLLSPVFLCFIQFFINKLKLKYKYRYEYELKNGLFLSSVFLISTLWFSHETGKFTSNSILEVIQILLPFIITFTVINSMNLGNIHSFMKISLLIVSLGLFYNEWDKLIILSNYTKISLLNSYSPFENNIFPQFAAPLGVYFIYNKHKSPYMAILSLVINFLIFKRVLLLMLLLLFCIKSFKFDNIFYKLGRLTYSFWIIWFLTVSLTYYMYLPENSLYFEHLLNIDFAKFTMARIYRFWYVIEQGFTPYGLGSAAEFLRAKNLSYIGIDFELDFIRIMFEIGPIAVVTYILVMLRICKQNLYAVVVVNFYFLNFLMANGMFQYWSITLLLITIAFINTSSKEIDDSDCT